MIEKPIFEWYNVYVVSNLGFYESEQISILLEIVKNWCSRMGFPYGGGLAIGAGEMMGSLKIFLTTKIQTNK